ncbi:hypothetical protein [Dyadobacter sp. 676]|uniref:Uncharacterized protein n=1 Tax=Dyadobacter sp. 676 TaxID=3088362 RepID=A0AAU8FMQ0_9BACT
MCRRNYLIAASVMFAAEVWIALYVHDDLVRPWGGDVLEALPVLPYPRVTWFGG